jgi:glycine/D-amino acid oxidase-like deaminating enzyme
VSGEYDLAVIGAGLCGLSIARHAAEAGLRVVVCEAGQIGSGASGRNAGFVVPHLPGAMCPEDVETLLGRPRAEKLIDLVATGPRHVFEMIERHAIRCDPEQTGWVQPAHSRKSLERISRVFASWQRRGADATWLGASDLHALTGAPGYMGGWLGHTGGSVNPYALTLGLARLAQEKGAVLCEEVPVSSLMTDGNGAKVLQTTAGEIRARKVVLSTNGYTLPKLGPVAHSVIPLRLFLVLTRPLTAEEREIVLPARVSISDLRKSGGFTRLDGENRLVTGGAVFAGANKKRYGLRHANWRIAEIFPQLAGIEIEHYWEGNCALTDSALPEIQRVNQSTYALVGFSTRGLALSMTLGQEIARLLSETKTEADMPVPVGSVRPIPMQPLKAALGAYAFPFFQARDLLKTS